MKTLHPDWSAHDIRVIFVDAEASASVKDAAAPNGDYCHASDKSALCRATLLKTNPYPDAPCPFLSAQMRKEGARFALYQ